MSHQPERIPLDDLPDDAIGPALQLLRAIRFREVDRCFDVSLDDPLATAIIDLVRVGLLPGRAMFNGERIRVTIDSEPGESAGGGVDG